MKTKLLESSLILFTSYGTVGGTMWGVGVAARHKPQRRKKKKVPVSLACSFQHFKWVFVFSCGQAFFFF